MFIDLPRQGSETTYSLKLDSTAFWNRLIEHVFVVAFFAWLSAGFLTKKEFRVDLTEAHLMEVPENVYFSIPAFPLRSCCPQLQTLFSKVRMARRQWLLYLNTP